MTDEATDPPKEPKRRVAYKVVQFFETGELKADLSYSMADLTSAMTNQASLLVHYGVLLAKASKQVDDLKMLLETAEARIYRKLRDEHVAAKEKPTEAMLAKLVAGDGYYVSIIKALNEAKQIEAQGKTAVEAFRHRKDMLIQLGLLAREEIKGDVSINRRKAVDEQQEAQRERIRNQIKQDQGQEQ